MTSTLSSPWPYPGGKSMVADTVWRYLGNVGNFIEPFAGSAAVLLARPQPFTGTETINDKNGFVCVAPETLVLMRDLTWKQAGNLQEGEDLLAFDEENPGQARPGLKAPKGYRKWRASKVVAAPRVQLPCYRLTFDDGTVVVASEDHCWLAGSHRPGHHGGRGWHWVKTKNMAAGRSQRSWVLKLLPVVHQEMSRDAGWLAGIFDGEGDVGANLGISQNHGLVLNQAMAGLRERGFDLSSDTTKKCVRLKVLGGLREKFRLLMTLRPERLIRNFLGRIETKSLFARDHQAVGLVSKEYIGVQEVVALATTTKTFVAEGLASHNCNAWRAIQADPEGVAKHADHPSLESDLHARHRWLWERKDMLQARLESDPDWYDAKMAGWWIWGMSNFFSGAWCTGIPRRCKLLCTGGNTGGGIMRVTKEPYAWMCELQDRLKRVRVLCGDFKRALTPSVTINYRGGSPTGVFLDPPYDHEGRDSRVYGAEDSPDVFQEALDWAIANANENTRIIVAGYDSRPMPTGWREVEWQGHGGHGRRRDEGANVNKNRERLWLSPHCVQPNATLTMDDLFSGR